MQKLLPLAILLAVFAGTRSWGSVTGEAPPPVEVRFELLLAAPAGPPLVGSLVLTPDAAGTPLRVLPVQGKAALSTQLPAVLSLTLRRGR